MNGSSIFRCNMMITRKYIFDAYCQWLFSFILPVAKGLADFLKDKPSAVKRTSGFIAERMLSVWLINNHIKIGKLPILTIM